MYQTGEDFYSTWRRNSPPPKKKKTEREKKKTICYGLLLQLSATEAGGTSASTGCVTYIGARYHPRYPPTMSSGTDVVRLVHPPSAPTDFWY
eukprot:1155693-Rhodomonas_salina.1